jgi:hypothetical protein
MESTSPPGAHNAIQNIHYSRVDVALLAQSPNPLDHCRAHVLSIVGPHLDTWALEHTPEFYTQDHGFPELSHAPILRGIGLINTIGVRIGVIRLTGCE